MLNQKFFAVTSDNHSSWDIGSYDLVEALELAREHRDEGNENTVVAIIDEETDCCLFEIGNLHISTTQAWEIQEMYNKLDSVFD